MAYYIDQEEKKRVLSEDMEELERIEKAEKFLRNRDQKSKERAGIIKAEEKPKELDVFDQYRILDEDYNRQQKIKQ